MPEIVLGRHFAFTPTFSLLYFRNHRSELLTNVQVLQTLYILISNMRSKTALYYICSNNHVNDLVTLAFDFEDEEVLGYYINLLKSISLQLTIKTAQFFFMVTKTPLQPFSQLSWIPSQLLQPFHYQGLLYLSSEFPWHQVFFSQILSGFCLDIVSLL